MDIQGNKFEDYFCLCLDASSSSVLSSVMFISDILGMKHDNARIHVIDYRTISRYYISIILANYGMYQKANEFSLSIIEFSINSTDELKLLSLYLGLLSWGYIQYRIGRKHEGIMCVIAASYYCRNRYIRWNNNERIKESLGWLSSLKYRQSLVLAD